MVKVVNLLTASVVFFLFAFLKKFFFFQQLSDRSRYERVQMGAEPKILVTINTTLNNIAQSTSKRLVQYKITCIKMYQH